MGMDMYCYEIEDATDRIGTKEELDDLYIGEKLTTDTVTGLEKLFRQNLDAKISYEVDLDSIMTKYFNMSMKEVSELNKEDLKLVWDAIPENKNKYFLLLNQEYIDLIKLYNTEDEDGFSIPENSKKSAALQTEIEEFFEGIYKESKFNEILQTKYGKALAINETGIEGTYSYGLSHILRREIGYMRKPFRHLDKEENNKTDTFVVGNFKGVEYESVKEVFEKETIYTHAYAFIDFDHAEAIDILAQFVPEESRKYFLELKPQNKNQIVCIDW
jgi:hypothetical protein